ncbi:MAG TPA: ABC transporter permease [Candidatus Acidoferrales bacterium]|nr:ABC transporter permease [Candidatus Acidoferrales bacterium]
MKIRMRLRSLFRDLAHRGESDRDLDAEVRAHLDLLTEEKLRDGLPPAEARRAAAIELGGLEQVKEEVRAVRSGAWLEILWQDLCYGARQLRRSPGFTALALLTLALGIAANTAIFSVVEGVLLRPIAYSHSERLYIVREVVPQWSKFAPSLAANLPDFHIWQKQVHSFDGVALAESTSAILSGSGDPERIYGVRASANLLGLLGVQPALGRSFLPEEDEPGRGRVVLLSDGFWRARFHADPALIGAPLTLDGVPYLVIGILPPGFELPAAFQDMGYLDHRQVFLQPLDGPKPYEQDLIGEFDFGAIARLMPGVTPEAALAELNGVQAQIARQANQGLDLRGQLRPAGEAVVGPARSGLLFLFSAVGAVLLIVCANLAGLLLARVPGRMRQAAVRRALGATRLRLVCQLLTESFLLSFAGGALGFWLASLALGWLVHYAPLNLPRLGEVHMDGRVLLFAFFVTTATGALFGILPAWRITRVLPMEAMKFSPATHSPRIRHARETLVGVEVALTTMLLILAGLLITSLARLLQLDPGFAVHNVLAVDVDLPSQSYSSLPDRLQFYERALEGVRALPGVQDAGWVSLMPLSGQGSVTGIGLPGRQAFPEENPAANYRSAGSGYFRAMGIPLLRGRIYTDADRGRNVVVISKSVADRFWPGKNPVGRTCVTQWAGDVESEVIGVVGDVRTVRLEDSPLLMVYVPHWFNQVSVPASASIIIHSSVDPAGLGPAVRDVIRRAGHGVAVVSLVPMDQVVSDSLAPRRFQMFLILAFALASLFLAGLGIFGVIAYSVEQRRRELGIRLALGAQLADLRNMVLREGMSPVLLGLAGGIVAAILAGSLIRSLLFGVAFLDPLTIASVTFVVFSVALMASYFPARRAMRVDPIAAIRYE